jgi:hypothetical protein
LFFIEESLQDFRCGQCVNPLLLVFAAHLPFGQLTARAAGSTLGGIAIY